MRLGLRTTDRLGKWESDKYIVGFGLFMGFVDNNKYIDYHQHYPLRIEIGVSCVFVLKRIVDIRFMPAGGLERPAEEY